MVNWTSLLIPVSYLGVLVGSLVTFSYLYRKRKAAHSAGLTPWFGPHLQRNIYLSLLHHEQISPETNKPVQVPDSVIKAALLRRAAEDISRIVQLRNAKQALGSLLQRGSVGDDLWQRFQRAEKELEAELEDVVNEANALSPNWGSHIFQSANEIAANTRLRARVAEIQEKAVPEREWWTRRREALRAEFMKELDGDKTAPAAAAGATAKQEKKTERAEKTDKTESAGGSAAASDEDAVLVESGGPTTGSPTTSTGGGGQSGAASGGGGGKKKKKGKK